MYSLCMAHIWPMYDLYMAYMAVFLYMPSLVYLLVRRFLSMLKCEYIFVIALGKTYLCKASRQRQSENLSCRFLIESICRFLLSVCLVTMFFCFFTGMAIRGRWVGTLEIGGLKLKNKTIKTVCFKQPALQVGRWSLGSRCND